MRNALNGLRTALRVVRMMFLMSVLLQSTGEKKHETLKISTLERLKM